MPFITESFSKYLEEMLKIPEFYEEYVKISKIYEVSYKFKVNERHFRKYHKRRYCNRPKESLIEYRERRIKRHE